jgi:phosphoribosylanthranilate isomerase
MFTIKICGITNVEDARMVVESGADAVGINFYAGSPRFVPIERAMHVAAVVPKRVVKVGLFVNANVETISAACDGLGLDLVQLHGDEPPEFVAALGRRPVMRAFRVGEDGLTPVAEYLKRCRELRCVPRMVLLDAFRAGHYGGTGNVADWDRIRRERALLGEMPLVLAGGLTPDNVAAAIEAVRPAAVDAASGVESSPGHQDAGLVRRFVEAARAAFDAINPAC